MADTEDREAGRWHQYGRRTAYRHHWVHVELVDVQAPNGHRWEHHAIALHPVAIALVTNDHDQALLLWRHRFVTDQWAYELPGGLVEPGEDPADTATRELHEETGWQPRTPPQHLITFQPMPGILNAPVHLFHITHAEHTDQPTDTEEAAPTTWIPLAAVPELAQRGQLASAATLIGLLWHLHQHPPQKAHP